MTDVKRLLDEATPLPWRKPFDSYIYGEGTKVAQLDDPWIKNPNAAADGDLIVHAVNRLPDYEAAVDALERVLRAVQATEAVDEMPHIPLNVETALISAREALHRLRGES